MNASVVSNVLNKGMMIGIRVGSNSQWHGNVIYEVTGSSIRIAYIEKFMKDKVDPGSPIWVKFSNDYFIYYFYGKVSSITADLPRSILVKVDSAEEIINNRLFPRYDVRLKACLKATWDDEVFEGTVTDISYGGASFVCEHKFDNNENIDMSLYLPNNVIAKLNGRVIRLSSSDNNCVSHAAQFIECDNMCNKQLSVYFSQLEDEVSEIYQQYLNVYKQSSCNK
ncbi:MAG: PilZ domain-containing protein [Clostridia bacterium]|nr:PilZ domain-containing protein [Clostridia bacterium]